MIAGMQRRKNQWWQSLRRVVFTIVVCGSLVGCNTATLRDDLSQDQANEVVAALVRNGIHASVERETGGRGKYRVEVKRAAYSEAVSLLHDLGLPSQSRASFSDMIASRGLMPDSREVEALRLDRALAAELEEAIENNPAILSARVIVRLNSTSLDVLGEGAEAGVSAVVRTRPGSEAHEEDIRAVLSQGVPGVDAEHIRIQMHHAISSVTVTEDTSKGGAEGVERIEKGIVRRVPLTNFLWIWRVPEDEYNSLAGGVLVGIASVFLLGILVGSAIISARRNSKVSEGGAASAKRLPPARADRKKELPEPPKE